MKIFILNLVQNLNILFSYISNKGFSEKQFLNKILEDDSIVIDVGSNLGNFLKSVIKVKKNIKYYSIEPIEKLLSIQKNKFKKFKKIYFENVAIGVSNSIENFYIRDPLSHSSLSLNHPVDTLNKVVEIKKMKTITLQTFLQQNNIKKIKLLKLDTEGFDYLILKSLENLLVEKKIEYMKVECDIHNFKEIIKFLTDLNLEVVGISNFMFIDNKLIYLDLYFKN